MICLINKLCGSQNLIRPIFRNIANINIVKDELFNFSVMKKNINGNINVIKYNVPLL